MEKNLYDKNGDAKASIASDFSREMIYLWDGTPVAYFYEEEHVYGINGRHLGWFRNEMLYNNKGERVGFTHTNCPVSIAKAPPKGKKQSVHEMRSRWSAPPAPKWSFSTGTQTLTDFLQEGAVVPFQKEKEGPAEEKKKEGAAEKKPEQ
jgi:hypothetical protein